MVEDVYSIVAKWRNYFSQLLNVHWINDVRHREIQTAKPLVPEPIASEFELPIEEIKITNHQALIEFQQN